jgi:uncharacterized membrane protein YgcG
LEKKIKRLIPKNMRAFFIEITTDGISTMTKPITNDSTKKGKYNMIPDFCKNDLTQYIQSTIKPIVLIVTTQVQVPDPEAAHLQTPSSHRRHYRHNGL